jgi:hypothetical protein
MRVLATFLALLSLQAAAGGALAQTPRALLYTEPGHPLSLIPGHNPGLAINSFSIGYLAYSPNGRRWVVSGVARNGVGSSPSPTVVLAGDDSGIRQAIVQNVPMPGSGLAFAVSPTSLAINDAGDFAFNSSVTGGSSINRVFVARCRAATGLCDVAARQDSPIPGLASVLPGAAGERYGSLITVMGVMPDGRVAMLAENTSGPLASDQDELMLIEGDPVRLLAQAGVLVPSGQAAGGAEVLINMDRRLGIDADGSRWIVGGQLNGTGFPDVVVLNGGVVLQRGVPVPGLNGDTTTPRVAMNGRGRWLAQGTTTLGQGYLVVEGKVRLTVGSPVPGHPSRGVVTRIAASAVNERRDIAYAITTSTFESLLMVERKGGPPVIVADAETPLDVGFPDRPPVLYSSPLDGSSKPMYFAGDRLYFLIRTISTSTSVPSGDGLFVLDLAALGMHGWDRGEAAGHPR